MPRQLPAGRILQKAWRLWKFPSGSTLQGGGVGARLTQDLLASPARSHPRHDLLPRSNDRSLEKVEQGSQRFLQFRLVLIPRQ